jgi:hypothetical protein
MLMLRNVYAQGNNPERLYCGKNTRMNFEDKIDKALTLLERDNNAKNYNYLTSLIRQIGNKFELHTNEAAVLNAIVEDWDYALTQFHENASSEHHKSRLLHSLERRGKVLKAYLLLCEKMK